MKTISSLDELKDAVVDDITIEMQRDDMFDPEILAIKVENVITEVINTRRYPSSYSDEAILADVLRFYSNIRNISIYDYNQIGVEFERVHYENTVHRSWEGRGDLFKGIIPIAKVIS